MVRPGDHRGHLLLDWLSMELSICAAVIDGPSLLCCAFEDCLMIIVATAVSGNARFLY